MRFLSGITPGGEILDVACGGGRHARASLEAGFQVTAVDRNLSGVMDLAGHPNLHLVERDLESGPVPIIEPGRFAGVIVTNYLWRPILSHIAASLKSDGVLIYETFALGNERFGKPSNPDFLLRPGELIDAFTPTLTPIAYEHVTERGATDKVVQRLCAVGPSHGWLSAPPIPG